MSANPLSFEPQISANRVLSYQHPDLVTRLQRELRIGEAEALMLFNDLKRFLFLCGISAERLGPTDRIDEAWHNFILYTRDYRNFCMEQFGKFIEHVPTSTEDRHSRNGSIIRSTSVLARQVFGERLSANWKYRQAEGGSCLSDCTRCSGSSNCNSEA